MPSVDQNLMLKRDVMDAMRRAFNQTQEETVAGKPLFFVVSVQGLASDELKPMLELLGQENPGLLFMLGFNTEVVAQVEVKNAVAS